MSDIQVQHVADNEYRPYCETVRGLLYTGLADRAGIDDVYNYLNGAGSGWVDGRTDGPPGLLNASNMLAINSFQFNMNAILSNSLTVDADKIAAVNAIQSAMPVVLKACVRPVTVG